MTPLIALHCLAAPLLPVEVRDHVGSPAIYVGGEPIVPLMFFGIPQEHRHGTAELTPEWQECRFVFVPDEDNQDMGGVQFRVGGGPAGSVWVDDCRVHEGPPDAPLSANMLREGGFEGSAEEVAAAWTLWTSPEADVDVSYTLDAENPAEGRQCLRIDIRKSGDHPMHAHFFQSGMAYRKGQTYTYSLRMRSAEPRVVDFFALRQGGSFRNYFGPGAPEYASQVRLAAGAGVHIHSMNMPFPWPRRGEEYDWTGVDQAIEWTLAHDPDGLLLPRIGLYPPAWWMEEHPEAAQLFSDGKTEFWSMASTAWLADLEPHLRALVRHCEDRYGDHMLGYHPCGQNTGEWFYGRAWEPVLSDFSPAMTEGFRNWLALRYGSDTALKAAWGDETVSLDSAEIPALEAQRTTTKGWFRDPVRERRVIDYLRYQQDAMVGPLETIARIIKEETNRERLVVLFYGYTFELCGLPWGPAKSGHYALARLLECPDVDILCSPISYQDRRLGGSGDFMTAVDSVRGAGKLWLVEDDTRTHKTPPDSAADFPGGSTLEETQWIHTRQFGHILPRRLATWYMDLGATGWLDDPGIWERIARLGAVCRANMDRPAQWSPEVAVIVDEEAALYGAPTWELHRPLVYEMRMALTRAGAPVGYYLLSDLVAGRVPPARLCLLLNCFQLDASERAAVARQTAGRAAVWFYGAGYLADGPAADTAVGELEPSMCEATGLPIVRAEPQRAGAAVIGEPWAPSDPLLDPFWTVAEAQGVEVLDRTSAGAPALAVAPTAAGLRVYAAGLGTSSANLRELYRRAGVHIYCDSDDLVVTDDHAMCVSATSEGVKTIHLRRPARVTDALTGELVSSRASEFALPLRMGESRLLVLE